MAKSGVQKAAGTLGWSFLEAVGFFSSILMSNGFKTQNKSHVPKIADVFQSRTKVNLLGHIQIQAVSFSLI